MYRLASDVRALTKNDIALSASETQWCRLFVCAEPIGRKSLLRQN
jgi:hypothetical protein